jgi:5-methyltetrahydrofolate--homocysteine methyltransferase
MGTMLQANGYEPGDSPEQWALEHPEVLRGIHRAYIAAGADVILSNTFGANKPKLHKYGLDGRIAEMNRELVALLVQVAAEAGQPIYVAGDIGPTGEFMEPLGTISQADMIGMVAEQVQGLVAGGAELIFIETMMDVAEAVAAVKAAKAVCNLPVVASMSYNPAKRGYRTMMGNAPAQAAEALLEAGADVTGANCGNVLPEQMPEVIAALKAAGARWVAVEPNAGLPEMIDGQTVFSQGPEEVAASVPAILAAGANLIGGCCGTTPDHIRAIAAAVRA